jgi:Helix-turn-helix domain
MKTKPYSELRKRLTPEQRAKNKTRAKIMLLQLTLMGLKESLELTQNELESDLTIFKSAISELENQKDIQVSTLSRCIKALGGSLKLVANFPDKEIILAQFE